MPLLFSYGTLQEKSVQLSTFGRLLQGEPDELMGFEQSLLEVEDAYEPAGYRRVIAPLASGREAWVYADARSS